MSIIKILQHPNPRLREKAERLEDFGDETQKIIDDMFETHYAAKNCAALAATQLDFKNPKHITVIDFSVKKDQPFCLVNAKIIERDGEKTEEEGCMSLGIETGSIFEKVTRAATIKVRAQDRHGKTLEFEAEGFMAKCIQHELDHLDGKLFIDHLSPLKRARVEKQIKKLNRSFMKKPSEAQ